MHSHPDSVAVFLDDQKAKMTHPDGKSEEMSGKKGEAVFTPARAHLPENIGSGPIDLILVETKKPAAKSARLSSTVMSGQWHDRGQRQRRHRDRGSRE